MPKREELRWSDLRIGIAVAAVAALVLFAIFFAGSRRGPFLPETYTLHLDLDDAAGIRVGSPVRVGGVSAGEVAGLEIIAPREAPAAFAADTLAPLTGAGPDLRDIRIELTIQERFRPYVTTSSRARLANIGLGGERYVAISAGDVRDPSLEPGDEISAVASVDWDLVLARLARALNESRELANLSDEIGEKLEAGGGSLPRLLDENSEIYRTLPAMLAESRATLQVVEAGEGVFPQWSRDRRLKRSVDELARLVRAIEESIETGDGLAQWSDPKELRSALSDLETSLREMDAKIDRGRGTTGRMINDEELFVQIRVLRNRIDDLVAAFRADPLGFVDIDLF